MNELLLSAYTNKVIEQNNELKKQLEAYENARKEAIEYIENTDDFDIEIFNESTGGCLGYDLSNGAKKLLKILNKVEQETRT